MSKPASALTDHELALLAASGFERLWRDIHSQETLEDVAARRLEREEVQAIIDGPSVARAMFDWADEHSERVGSISIPGHERPRDYWETSDRNGFTDDGMVSR